MERRWFVALAHLTARTTARTLTAAPCTETRPGGGDRSCTDPLTITPYHRIFPRTRDMHTGSQGPRGE